MVILMSDDFIRMTSGISGLDTMIEGGYPYPSTVLVAGTTGSCKTTFGLQFLARGAAEGEQCLFFTTLSEPVQWMLRFASRWNFFDKSKIGNEIKYVELGPTLRDSKNFKDVLDYINEIMTDVMPQRVVIDPVTVVGNFFPSDYRLFLLDLSVMLKNWQTVTLLTGEINETEQFPLEVAYTTDAVILLSNNRKEIARHRSLEILKMRGTHHTVGENAMDVNYSGLTIYPKAS